MGTLHIAADAIRYDLFDDSVINGVPQPYFKYFIKVSTGPTPSTPDTGDGVLYYKADGYLYWMGYDGIEHNLLDTAQGAWEVDVFNGGIMPRIEGALFIDEFWELDTVNGGIMLKE